MWCGSSCGARSTALLIVSTWLATATTDGGHRRRGPRHGAHSRRRARVAAGVGAGGGRDRARPVAFVLAAQQRWRRLALVACRRRRPAPPPSCSSTGGWTSLAPVPTRSTTGRGWRRPGSRRCPTSPVWSAAAMVGKPWMSRPWRRATDVTVVALIAIVVVAGTQGRHRAGVGRGPRSGGGSSRLDGVRRAEPAAGSGRGGQSPSGRRSRHRRSDPRSGRRRAIAALHGRHRRRRGASSSRCTRETAATPTCCIAGTERCCCGGRVTRWPADSLQHDVEHHAFLLLLAGRGGVSCPRVEVVTGLPDGSMALALELHRRDAPRRARRRRHRRRAARRVVVLVRTLHDRHLAHRCATSRQRARCRRPAGADRLRIRPGLGIAEIAGDRPRRAADVARHHRRPGAGRRRRRCACSGPPTSPQRCRSCNRWRCRPRTRRAASKTLLRELRSSVEADDGRASGGTRAARAGPRPHRPDDRRTGRRLLRPAPAAGERRRQLRRHQVGELGMVGSSPWSCRW